MLTTLGYVLKNLGRQKVRTVLASVGVMLGVWLVVIFSGISAGIVKTAEAMLTQFGEDFHCYRKGAADQFLSVLPEAETREKLLSLPEIEETASVLYWAVPGGEAQFVFLIGLRPEEFAFRNLMERGSGGFRGDLEIDQAVVGEGRLEQLGIRRNGDGSVETGQDIRLGETSLRVVGSFLTGTPVFDNAVIVRMETMNRLRGGEDMANLVAVRVREGESSNRVKRIVEERFPEIATVGDLEELSKVDKSLERMRTISVVIGIVATGIALLFILLAMVMSVVERTREIGILRAVGWRKRRIVVVILIEAIVLAVIGVVAGIPTGLLGIEVISSLTELSDFIQPAYEVGLYIEAAVVALAAACLGVVYPAWRASRLHPVEAIRHE